MSNWMQIQIQMQMQMQMLIDNKQDYRFSDKEKNKLFACIEAYFTCFDRSIDSQSLSAFPLIEDALKVPCFTTKQKMQLLKWHQEILAKQDVPLDKPQPTLDQEENFDDFDWDAFEKEQD